MLCVIPETDKEVYTISFHDEEVVVTSIKNTIENDLDAVNEIIVSTILSRIMADLCVLGLVNRQGYIKIEGKKLSEEELACGFHSFLVLIEKEFPTIFKIAEKEIDKRVQNLQEGKTSSLYKYINSMRQKN